MRARGRDRAGEDQLLLQRGREGTGEPEAQQPQQSSRPDAEFASSEQQAQPPSDEEQTVRLWAAEPWEPRQWAAMTAA